MLRPARAAGLLLVALVAVGGCTLDRAELHEAGGVVTADLDDLRVLTYRDDPAADDWVDLVTPDPAILEEGDPFREEDSRTAADDQAADRRRLFTRTDAGRSVLVQFNRTTGELQIWDFVDEGGDQDGPLSSSGAADADAPNEIESGGYLTVLRDAGAGEADVVVDGDEDVTIEPVAGHAPDDGVEVYVDLYLVTGEGRATLTYDDGSGTTVYEIVAG